MKIVQLIFRILTFPFVFLLSFLAMLVFPGTLMLIMGTGQILYKLMGGEVLEEWKDLLIMTTMIFWYPFGSSWYWITEAKFLY